MVRPVIGERDRREDGREIDEKKEREKERKRKNERERERKINIEKKREKEKVVKRRAGVMNERMRWKNGRKQQHLP